jgi:eukaryotic-like serine/threonine-protein kinase
MSLRDQIRTVFRLFLLFTVLVAVGLLSAITTIRLTIHGRQATVPDLVGVPVERADRMMGNLGLGLKVEDKLYSDQYAANQIVSQVPASGTRMKAGQHVHVLVSLGPMRASVPNLVGTSVRAARIVALQRSLTVGDVASVYWPGTTAGQIVAQDPPPETTSVRSPAVNFLVSLGEMPPSYVCPSFIGVPINTARQELEKAGFQVGQVTPLAQTPSAPDTILGQSPAPGSKIGSDAVFNFQVAQ